MMGTSYCFPVRLSLMVRVSLPIVLLRSAAPRAGASGSPPRGRGQAGGALPPAGDPVRLQPVLQGPQADPQPARREAPVAAGVGQGLEDGRVLLDLQLAF